jgi:hypothetical protein
VQQLLLTWQLLSLKPSLTCTQVTFRSCYTAHVGQAFECDIYRSALCSIICLCLFCAELSSQVVVCFVFACASQSHSRCRRTTGRSEAEWAAEPCAAPAPAAAHYRLPHRSCRQHEVRTPRLAPFSNLNSWNIEINTALSMPCIGAELLHALR